jgi:hypothetical protein
MHLRALLLLQLLSLVLGTCAVANAQVPDEIQWARADTLELQAARRALSAAGGDRSPGEVAIAATGLLPRVTMLQPIVTSQRGVATFVAGGLGETFTVEDVLHRMQVVPGLPDVPRYQEPKFKAVREAFSKCAGSAAGYRQSTLDLLHATPSGFGVGGVLPLPAGLGSYDQDCLTPLDKIPLAVRQVVGVLAARVRPDDELAPFCTATIVGARSILTSKHCFVDADTGAATIYRARLFSEQLSFVPLVPDGGRSTFTMAAPAATVVALRPFGPADDHVVLTVKFWDLSHHASVTSAPVESETLPLAAWIVGSNFTLSDTARPRSLLELARGSAPLACSALEITPGGCIYHSCQTGPATSGAGLLVVERDESIRLVGVHKGPLVRSTGCEQDPPIDLQLNLATAITNDQITELLNP